MSLPTLGGVFSELSSASVRGLARNLFRGFYERGVSANKALTELRSLGLGYKRQEFLRDYAEQREGYNRAISSRFVNLNKAPSEGILQPAYHGVPDKYSFVFRESGYSVETGETTDRYFFIHRNTIATREEMEEDAWSWVVEEKGAYAVDITNVSLWEGYINPLWA